MRHVDLFSGIGGFALAARWAGFETVQFVEKDSFCQKVLHKNFPGVPIYDDITTFKWRGASPFILTGGFPCQPYSCAGLRKGNTDDRALWPEMLRVIQEARPTWVIGENVAGFISMGLDGCISDLEIEGYEVQAFIIPACAVNAPHRRDRVWIVAKPNAIRCGRRQDDERQGTPKGNRDKGSIIEDAGRSGFDQGRTSLPGQKGGGTFSCDTNIITPDAPRLGCGSRRAESEGFIGKSGVDNADRAIADSKREHSGSGLCEIGAKQNGNQPSNSNFFSSDTCGTGLQGSERAGSHEEGQTAHGSTAERFSAWNEPWLEAATRLCRVDDGLPRQVDRVNRLKALGNAIVPQVAYTIFEGIRRQHDRSS